MKDYVAAVLAGIRQKRTRQALSDELNDHLLCRAALYEERGFDPAAAREKANADMGETAETVGEQLSALHRSFWVFDALFHLLFLGLLAPVSFFGFYAFLILFDEPYLYDIGTPVVCVCLLALAVSYLRSYRALPVIATVYLLVASVFSIKITVFYGELLTGRLSAFYDNGNRYTLGPTALTIGVTAALACAYLAMGIAVTAHAVKRKRSLYTLRSRRFGQRAACAALALCVLWLAGYAANALLEKPRHLTQEKLVVIASERDLSACPENELRQMIDRAPPAADYEVYSFTPVDTTKITSFPGFETNVICYGHGEQRQERYMPRPKTFDRIDPFAGRLCLSLPPVETETARPYFTVCRIAFHEPWEKDESDRYRETGFAAECVAAVPGETITLSADGEGLRYTVALINGRADSRE